MDFLLRAPKRTPRKVRVFFMFLLFCGKSEALRATEIRRLVKRRVPPFIDAMKFARTPSLDGTGVRIRGEMFGLRVCAVN